MIKILQESKAKIPTFMKTDNKFTSPQTFFLIKSLEHFEHSWWAKFTCPKGKVLVVFLKINLQLRNLCCLIICRQRTGRKWTQDHWNSLFKSLSFYSFMLVEGEEILLYLLASSGWSEIKLTWGRLTDGKQIHVL